MNLQIECLFWRISTETMNANIWNVITYLGRVWGSNGAYSDWSQSQEKDLFDQYVDKGRVKQRKINYALSNLFVFNRQTCVTGTILQIHSYQKKQAWSDYKKIAMWLL